MFALGQAVRLIQPVSYHDAGAGGTIDIELPVGATGRITDLGDELNPIIIVKFDQPFACLDEWDNASTFDRDADGVQGVAVATECMEVLDAEADYQVAVDELRRSLVDFEAHILPLADAAGKIAK